ncbi:MAG: response regulator transcription factor [Actinomycetota bacterium]
MAVDDLPAPRHPDGAAPRVLVVDDEEVLLDLLRDALRFADYDVATAETGFEALRAAAEHRPDLIILDVNLPDLDGFEVCRRLRSDGDDVPVIFLTARDTADDLRTGFTRGGDDYLTKPFSLDELNMRMQAILRRRLTTSAATAPALRSGDVVMDDVQHRVWADSEELDLSPTEYRLLHYLLTNQGQALSKTQILDHVWHYDFGGDASVVETYISYLRRKLGACGAQIYTIRGVGYTMRSPEAP